MPASSARLAAVLAGHSRVYPRAASIVVVAVVLATGWLLTDRGGANDAAGEPGAIAVGDAEVADLLSRVTVVEKISPAPGYERECGKDKKTGRRQGCVFGKRWNDPDDHTGCDTRNRVAASQLSDVTFKPGTRRCKVVSGWVIDPYSGVRVELADIDIDHLVPLRRAFDSGAFAWEPLQRQRFANDMENLWAVSRKQNESKSSSGPGRWMPANAQKRCSYGTTYLRVVLRYGLPIDKADRRAIAAACHTEIDQTRPNE